MIIHDLKMKGKEWADRVYMNNKSFEIRYNDRDYQIGDHVRFHVVDENDTSIELEHPLNDLEYVITYLTDWQEALRPGWVVLNIQRVGYESIPE